MNSSTVFASANSRMNLRRLTNGRWPLTSLGSYLWIFWIPSSFKRLTVSARGHEWCDDSVFLHASVNHKIYYQWSAPSISLSKASESVCLRVCVNGALSSKVESWGHHITAVQLRLGTQKRIILHNKDRNPYLFLVCGRWTTEQCAKQDKWCIPHIWMYSLLNIRTSIFIIRHQLFSWILLIMCTKNGNYKLSISLDIRMEVT